MCEGVGKLGSRFPSVNREISRISGRNCAANLDLFSEPRVSPATHDVGKVGEGTKLCFSAGTRAFSVSGKDECDLGN